MKKSEEDARVRTWTILNGLQAELNDLTGMRNRTVFRLAKRGIFRSMWVIRKMADGGRTEQEMFHVGTLDHRFLFYDRDENKFFSGSAVVKAELGSKRHASLVSEIDPNHKDWPKLVKVILKSQKPLELAKSA